MGRRGVGAIVGRIQVIDGPGSCRIATTVDRDIGTSLGVIVADKENDGDPSVSCFVKETTRIARKLLQPIVEKHIDVERAENNRAIGAIDREGRVHRFEDEAIANAEPLVGRLKFGPEIGHFAVQAAHTVEVPQNIASLALGIRGAYLAAGRCCLASGSGYQVLPFSDMALNCGLRCCLLRWMPGIGDARRRDRAFSHAMIDCCL